MKSKSISRLLRRWANYLDPAKKAAPKKTADAVAGVGDGSMGKTGARRLDPTDPAGFREKLSEFRATSKNGAANLVTGSVKMLGFGGIKQGFGESWPTVQPMVRQIIEACIERRITGTDLYIPISDEHYLILFGGDPSEKAERKARLIAEDISARLCGSVPGAAKVSVTSIVLNLDKSSGIDAVKDLASLTGTVETAVKKAEERERQRFKEVSTGLEFVYWPTFNARKRLVSTYECLPAKPGADGAAVPLGPDGANGTGQFTAQLDLSILRAAAKGLETMLASRHTAAILVPVHWDTLSRRTFNDHYVDLFKGMPPQSKRHVMLEIIDIPEGVPQNRLREVLTTVFPFCLSFFARFPLDYRRFHTLFGSGLKGAIYDGGDCHRVTEGLMSDLKGFVERAREASLRPLFRDARSVDIASAAVKAGFEYVNGAAVAPRTERPGRPLPVKTTKAPS